MPCTTGSRNQTWKRIFYYKAQLITYWVLWVTICGIRCTKHHQLSVIAHLPHTSPVTYLGQVDVSVWARKVLIQVTHFESMSALRKEVVYKVRYKITAVFGSKLLEQKWGEWGELGHLLYPLIDTLRKPFKHWWKCSSVSVKHHNHLNQTYIDYNDALKRFES